MYKFSDKSKDVLGSCDKRIQYVMNELIKRYDCSIIWGFRDQGDQDLAFHTGLSTKKYPDSKHNTYPSLAVDVVPYPTRYSKPLPFYYMAGMIFIIAESLDIHFKWGGDFDADLNFYNDKWLDLAHFEIVENKSKGGIT